MKELQESVLQFARDRDWEKFHSPKNLSMALAVEASELMEIFQWLTESQSRELDAATRQKAAEELADVFLYCLLLADKLDIELLNAAKSKMQKNALNYPADEVRGSARKYHEYSKAP
jgi:dCTP diphosphatase